MKEPSLSRTMLAHAVTVLVTLGLVVVFFSGGRLGGRLLPAQVAGRQRQVEAPPPPRPANEQPIDPGTAREPSRRLQGRPRTC